MMKLYYAETINARKACAVAKYLDAPVTYVRVDLRSGENAKPPFLALNPNGKVPVLETAPGVTLWESNAIMCHLARAAGSDLWPNDARQIEALRWMFWNSEHFSRHAARLYFENLVKSLFGLPPGDPAALEEAVGFVRTYGAVLNAHLKGRRWLVGDTLTIADFAVAASLPYAEGARIPIDEFPEVLRWHARLNEIPAWRVPFPETKAEAAA